MHDSSSAAPAGDADLDWTEIANALDRRGHAVTPALLSPADCAEISLWWSDQARFRKRIVMAAHGYGEGEYQYFRYPLPPLLERLRTMLYAGLAPIANRWAGMLGEPGGFPEALPDYLRRCHEAGQNRPTPLLLRYAAGGYNCLHQDLYGPLVFPIQATILLSRPQAGPDGSGDFAGGEFLLVEQRPRAQSMGEVVPLAQGQAVLFAVHHRPATGKRGVRRLFLRHGVSRIRSGERYTLGLIFHDAA